MLEGRTVGNSKKAIKSGLEIPLLEGRTVGNCKKGIKKGLGYSMVQGRTAVGRAMLEGRSVGNRTKVIKNGDDKDSREMVGENGRVKKIGITS
jgi:hypothetical protein